VRQLEKEFKKLDPLVSADRAANEAFFAFFVSPPQNVADRGAFWAYLLRAARNRLRNQIEAEKAQKRRPNKEVKQIGMDDQMKALPADLADGADVTLKARRSRSKQPRVRVVPPTGGRPGSTDSFFTRSDGSLYLLQPRRKALNQELPLLTLIAKELLPCLKKESERYGKPELYTLVLLSMQGDVLSEMARKLNLDQRTIKRKLSLAYELAKRCVYGHRMDSEGGGSKPEV